MDTSIASFPITVTKKHSKNNMAQKYENGNFTAVMTEVDNVSNASSMVSCFNGADEVEIEELRRMRNVIFGDRAKLIAEYARIQLLEEDAFDTDSPDYDLFRLRWQRRRVRQDRPRVLRKRADLARHANVSRIGDDGDRKMLE